MECYTAAYLPSILTIYGKMMSLSYNECNFTMGCEISAQGVKVCNTLCRMFGLSQGTLLSRSPGVQVLLIYFFLKLNSWCVDFSNIYTLIIKLNECEVYTGELLPAVIIVQNDANCSWVSIIPIHYIICSHADWILFEWEKSDCFLTL